MKQTYSSGPSIPGPTTEGAYFQIKCITGYFWQDLLQIKSINCTKFGSWFPFHESCVRMSYFRFAVGSPQFIPDEFISE